MPKKKNHASWFKAQLESTEDLFVWAVEQIPQDQLQQPPETGVWPVQQHIQHMYTYEKLVLPLMEQWLPDAEPTPYETIVMMRHMWSEQERHWYKKEASHWLKEWQKLRKETTRLLKRFDDSAWETEIETTFWGVRSLLWMYTKSVHHTIKHTESVLKISVFADKNSGE